MSMEELTWQCTLVVVGLRVSFLGLGRGWLAGHTVPLIQRWVVLGSLCNFPDTKNLLKNSNLGIPIMAEWKQT